MAGHLEGCTEPAAGITDFRGQRVGSVMAVGYVGVTRPSKTGTAAHSWRVLCACGSSFDVNGRRLARALAAGGTDPVCGRCRGTGDAPARSRPRVTDHAVVRYLERRFGLDLDTVRREILPDEIADLVAKTGPGDYRVDGPHGPHRIRVSGDGTVVTVLRR